MDFNRHQTDYQTNNLNLQLFLFIRKENFSPSTPKYSLKQKEIKLRDKVLFKHPKAYTLLKK